MYNPDDNDGDTSYDDSEENEGVPEGDEVSYDRI